MLQTPTPTRTLPLAAAFLALVGFKALAATPPEQIAVPPGFKVELLRSASPREGSWVCMAIDPKGRLYLCPQSAAPDGNLFRATLTPEGKIAAFQPVPVKVSGAMGMLWAFDSLYFSGDGPEGHGIYRLRDTDGDDQLDAAQLFKKVPGGTGEHGAHAIVLGPDGKLYFTHGNSTPSLPDFEGTPRKEQVQEDTILAQIKDPVATFFDNLKVPYGTIVRCDPEGQKWELVATGLRNAYDIAFNRDGELFTYDSDMEWDVGLPWYRPTRILHLTSGAEFGFREGSSKWPEFFEDSLPSVLPIGLGSPTGIAFGTKSNFPTRYREALFAMDWTYGRILAVHLEPKGASYAATSEDFVKGKGLPVTDLEFGPDGAMYFIVGGRGTQAGLYRVSYTGPATEAPSRPTEASPARQLRHELEAFHDREDPAALELAWPQLKSEDRFLRFAARLAIERQPVATWRERALAESDPAAGLMALLALTRAGSNADREAVFEALEKFQPDRLDERLKLLELRVIEVTLARHGQPASAMLPRVVALVRPLYPAASFALNHELAPLLSRLAPAESVDATLDLLKKATTQEEKIWYALCLAQTPDWLAAEKGDRRAQFFSWFAKAEDFHGGNSFSKFLEKIRGQALARTPAGERPALLALTRKPAPPVAPPLPPRPFVQAWTVAELTPALEGASHGRNFARGRQLFAAAQCLACHHFGPDGGNVGPDLSAVGNRFNRHDLLEAIIEPSKAISEQYASFIITTKSGGVLAGQIAEENNDLIMLVTDPIAGTRQRIGATQIVSKELSPVSLMPPGLLNTLTRDEIFDLLAYLESGGNEKAAAFAPTP